MRCAILDLLVCIKSTRTQENLAWRYRDKSNIPENASCQEAASIHSWAGAEQVCSAQEGTKDQSSLTPGASSWAVSAKVRDVRAL